MSPDERARAAIRGGTLEMETAGGWDDLLARGIVYVKEPPGVDFDAGVHLCQSYYLDKTGAEGDDYRGYRTARFDGSLLGYSDTGADQVERIQLELALWERYLPRAVVPLLRAMNDLARRIVLELFARSGVKPNDVARITGGMESNEALQYCIFNNFESRKQGTEGFTPHKDSGFIQLMYIDEPGLEVWEDERWTPVDPVPGYLIALTGHSLEVLTARQPVRAAAPYHRVRGIELRGDGRVDRTSFGVYIGPRFEQDLYQYDESGRLTVFQSFMGFQRQKAAEMGYDFGSVHAALAAGAPSGRP